MLFYFVLYALEFKGNVLLFEISPLGQGQRAHHKLRPQWSLKKKEDIVG